MLGLGIRRHCAGILSIPVYVRTLSGQETCACSCGSLWQGCVRSAAAGAVPRAGPASHSSSDYEVWCSREALTGMLGPMTCCQRSLQREAIATC